MVPAAVLLTDDEPRDAVELEEAVEICDVRVSVESGKAVVGGGNVVVPPDETSTIPMLSGFKSSS